MQQNMNEKKMKQMNILNIYKLNIYQVLLTFMFKIKRDNAPGTFRKGFREISHCYPRGFGQSNFLEGKILSNQTKFTVSFRGLRLRNRLLNHKQKTRHILMALKNQ